MAGEQFIQITEEDAHRLIMSMKNAEAIAQTLCKHGEVMATLEERINTLAGMIQTFQGEVNQLRATLGQAIQGHYGTGPTVRE